MDLFRKALFKGKLKIRIEDKKYVITLSVINKQLKKGEKETNIKIRNRNIPKRETAFVNLIFKNSQREVDEIKATKYVKY